ncbi:hypothetical protein SAMN05421747_12217 [Parapedobacter composti]|uniref:Uncharacterized protein n=1 Tax=Parapedobacter composti TaxID=623281 RepID=A0A1I1LK98_9SPHI|nr:hypothetical protein SAMN05421747_12217 [Parapedobacter composti]
MSIRKTIGGDTFNRTIQELKYVGQRECAQLYFSFNRTIQELK